MKKTIMILGSVVAVYCIYLLFTHQTNAEKVEAILRITLPKNAKDVKYFEKEGLPDLRFPLIILMRLRLEDFFSDDSIVEKLHLIQVSHLINENGMLEDSLEAFGIMAPMADIWENKLHPPEWWPGSLANEMPDYAASLDGFIRTVKLNIRAPGRMLLKVINGYVYVFIDCKPIFTGIDDWNRERWDTTYNNQFH